MIAMLLLACTEVPVDVSDTAEPEVESFVPVVDWAMVYIVTDYDTTAEVIVSDADGDVVQVVMHWYLDDYLVVSYEQTDCREHDDGRLYCFTRHPTVSPRNRYEVIAYDSEWNESEPFEGLLGPQN